MRCLYSLVVLFGIKLLTPDGHVARGQPHTIIPDIEQLAIAKSVERGLNYLKREQRGDGSWVSSIGAGAGGDVFATSLAGLALWEGGLTGSDQELTKAAAFVRSAVTENYFQTDGLSFAILFLDSIDTVGKDKFLIRKLAERLEQGQQRDGGWARSVSGPGATELSDNLNTACAALALWSARVPPYQVEVHSAIRKIQTRYRTSQRPDGGWGDGRDVGQNRLTPTCAALIALALGYASAQERAMLEPTPLPIGDLKKDRQVTVAVKYLAQELKDKTIREWRTPHQALWLLGRACASFDWTEDIAGVRWFDLGANHLLASQLSSGSWAADRPGVIDTSYAILFLQRNKMFPRHVFRNMVVKSGGLRSSIRPPPVVYEPKKTFVAKKGIDSKRAAELAEEFAAAQQVKKLGDELAKASDGDFKVALAKLAEMKEPGARFAAWRIAEIIPQTQSEERRDALRTALDRYVAHLTVPQLKKAIGDFDLEIRKAAVRVGGSRNAKVLLPEMIELITHQDTEMQAVVLDSLKKMSGRDFGLDIARWKAWAERETP